MEDNTEEALGIWGRVKEAVTRPDDYEFNPPLTRDMGFLSRNKDRTPLSVEAASFMAEALPLVGDAIAAKEVWDEINKAEPNWALVGALGGATVVGLIPGVGDAAAKAIKEGAKKGLDVARRIEVDPNAMGSMGGNIRLRPEAPRFNEEALAAARKQNDASREILVDMPIDDFLSAAKTGVDDSKLAGTRSLVAEGTPFESVPFLSFKNNGDGTGQVTGHEGRHRALALKEQGDTTIPVRLTSQGGSGPAIRWGKQLDPDDFDYVENIPTRLIEEGGSSVVPMPDSILNLRSTSPDKAGPTNLDAWSEGAYFKDPEAGKQSAGVNPRSSNLSEVESFTGDLEAIHGYGSLNEPGPLKESFTERGSYTGERYDGDGGTFGGGGVYLERLDDREFSDPTNPILTFPKYVKAEVPFKKAFVINPSTSSRVVDYLKDGRYSFEREATLDLPTRLADEGYDGIIVTGFKRYEDFLDGPMASASEADLDKAYRAHQAYVGDLGIPEDLTQSQVFKFNPEEVSVKEHLTFNQLFPDFEKTGYAQGGVVQQMNKMYDEGGLATDGMDVDPVSGNDIPVGSNAEDVRDDVDAKLSSGEYVVPADVVKYLGVAQLEKLVNKAKDGLEDMAENGRMGGEPVEDDMSDMEEEYTLGADLGNLDGYAAGGLVEGMDYNAIIDRVKAAAVKDPSITNMLKAKGIFIQEPQPQGSAQQAAMSEGTVPAQAAPPAVEGEATPAAFAEGGLVYGEGDYNPNKYAGSYNPYEHTMGFSIESGATGQAPGTPYQAPTEAEVPVCPEGYVWDPEIKVCMPVKAAQPSQPKRSSGRTTMPPKAPANPNAWMDKYTYSNPETLFEESMAKLGAGSTEGSEEESSWLGSLGDAAKGLLSGGLAGGLVGKFMNTTSSAQVAANAITLRAMGREDLAGQLEAQNAIFVKDNGLELVPEFMRDGDRLAEAVKGQTESTWNTSAVERATPTGLASRPSTRKADPVSDRVKKEVAAVSAPAPVRKKGPSLAQKALQKRRDAKKAEQAASVAKSEKAPTGTTTVGRSNVNNTTGEKKETYASKVSRGGGFAKGGLVSRRKPKK